MPKDNETPASAVIRKRKVKSTTKPASKISRDWTEEIRKSSLFSARTTRDNYLVQMKRRLTALADGKVNAIQAEDMLRRTLASIGYTPQEGFPGDKALYPGEIPPATPGGMTDLSSSARLRLIEQTQVRQARSMGQLASSENPVFLLAFPAWRLERQGARKKARGDWMQRWQAAGRSVGWQGALRTDLVALKTSPIWNALGNGAGDFDDTLGLPFPPFAFGSGMAWGNVGRSEWRRLCAAEGVDDGLDAVTEEARKLKRG